jgi:hypothetical protein
MHHESSSGADTHAGWSLDNHRDGDRSGWGFGVCDRPDDRFELDGNGMTTGGWAKPCSWGPGMPVLHPHVPLKEGIL